MILKARGYCAIHLPWAGIGFPNDLRPAPGAAPLTWDELGAQLAAHGANWLRVKFCGWNGPLGSTADSFESSGRIVDGRYRGNFNDWGGRLQQFADMCRAHDIRVHAIPFDNAEWVRRDAWSRHAWNAANGGFLNERKEALSPRTYQAAEGRIDALIQRIGDVIGAWELCAEMAWMLNPGFFEVGGWDAMPAVIHGTAVPWVEHMAQYIHAHHGAPVGNGQVRDLGGSIEIRNEVHRTPSLDFALINWYGANSVASKMHHFRAAQAYTGKPIYVEQYAPWALGKTAPYTREDTDFSKSKEHEWAAACGEYGFSGPMRWPEIRPTDNISQWWGVAHPNMAEMAGITAEMAGYVDLSKWTGRGQAWDARIVGATDYVSSWCDGSHLTAFVAWDGTNDTDLEIRGLQDGDYTASWFDWIVGSFMARQAARSVGGTLTLLDAPDRADHSALYLSRQDITPTPQTRLRVRLSTQDGKQIETVVEAGQRYTYTLDVEEVTV